MKKRLLSLIVIATLSLSALVGCSETKDTPNDTNTPNISEITDTDSSDKDNTKPVEDTDSDSDTNTDSNIVNTETKIKDFFTSAIQELYNTDYSSQENKDLSKEFINKNFTENGAKNLVSNLNEYDSSFEASDLLITNLKEIKSDNTKYVKSYEVRYNVVITSGKPSSYADLTGIIVEDASGNLFIDSLNENNF